MKKLITAEDKKIINNFATESIENAQALVNWSEDMYRDGMIKGWGIALGGVIIGNVIAICVGNKLKDRVKSKEK